MPNPIRLHVLVVDDNRSSADALARLLRKRGDVVHAAYDGQSAIDRIQAEPPDVVLTDLKMEPVDGMAVLAAARAVRPPVDTIVFTAFGAVDLAVQAMHLGARDFLTKPVTMEQVSARLDALRTGSPEPVAPAPEDEDAAFLALSASSRAVLESLQRAAGVPSAVWLEGEIGSGRTYCARTLHRLGGTDTPFTVRNITRDGPWPTSGTVVLPNVDDLPEDLQAELVPQLDALPAGVRVVATAQPGGRQRVADGSIRPELFYRLAVVVIPVPPLRRRQEDIQPLFEHGLSAYAARYDRPVPSLSDTAQRQLSAHYWPGNIRELLNLAERTVVLGVNAFDLAPVEDSGAGLPKLEPGFSLPGYLEGVERSILVEALRRAGGDRTQAGRLLGVERNTLRYKLNKYGLLDK